MRHRLAVDATLALLVYALAVLILFSGGLGEPDPDTRDGDALGVALLALVTLPLAARRAEAPLAVPGAVPGLVLAISVAGLVPYVLLLYPPEVSNASLLAVYSLASARGRDPWSGRAALALAAGTFAVVAASVTIAYGGFLGAELLTIGVIWLAVWTAGDRARLRRERMAELEERAQRAERDAERERRLAAAEERTRIARELHDSAGHAMNVILVQAGAARLLRGRDPERAREAVETIERVARGTIGDIDRLVRALREDGRAGDPHAAPLPGISNLDDLAEHHRDAGLTVTTRTEGRPRRLPAGVDRAAYRIVQEALTNAARHGRGSAEVVVSFGGDALEISVTNPTHPNGSARTGGGHGLVGMRERAALLGGSLTARGEDGVFRVRARLPYG